MSFFEQIPEDKVESIKELYSQLRRKGHNCIEISPHKGLSWCQKESCVDSDNDFKALQLKSGEMYDFKQSLLVKGHTCVQARGFPMIVEWCKQEPCQNLETQ